MVVVRPVTALMLKLVTFEDVEVVQVYPFLRNGFEGKSKINSSVLPVVNRSYCIPVNDSKVSLTASWF